MNTDIVDFRNTYKDKAEHNILTRLVLENIFKVEKIEITDEDVTNKLSEVAREYGRDADEFVAKATDAIRDYAREELKYDLAVKFIMDNLK